MFSKLSGSVNLPSVNSESDIKSYEDSIKTYLALDSNLRVQPSKLDDNDYYKVKYFIKCSLSMGSLGKTNIMDTSYVFFDKDFKVLGDKRLKNNND